MDSKLKELDLYEFKEIMEQIAESWFEKDITRVYEETESVIIFSGAYGTKDLYYLLHMEKLRKKYHSQKLARLAYIGEMVFLEYDGMCVLYPFLKRFPVLLPFCWVHRIIKTIFRKQDRIKSQFDYMKKMDEA